MGLLSTWRSSVTEQGAEVTLVHHICLIGRPEVFGSKSGGTLCSFVWGVYFVHLL